MIHKAMILAAGKGTRMLPITEDTPKALIKVGGITLLEHTINYLRYFGIQEIIINVHHLSESIIKFIESRNNFNVRIEFSHEKNELLGTGGGLLNAKWFFNNDPFILIASDIVTNLNLHAMMDYHFSCNPLATLAVKHRTSTREFIFDREGNLVGWENNMTKDNVMIRKVDDYWKIAFSAIHIIDPTIFGLMHDQGSFSITNTYLELAKNNIIKGYLHDDDSWFECGRIDNLNKLNTNPLVNNIITWYRDRTIST